jgi:hypothetical protein
MTKHVHANEIHAFAEGAEIQMQAAGSEEWKDDPFPFFWPSDKYRIKPRTVKREGWVAIYKHFNGVSHLHDHIYAYKEDAENSCPCATDIIKIEWLEDV